MVQYIVHKLIESPCASNDRGGLSLQQPVMAKVLHTIIVTPSPHPPDDVCGSNSNVKLSGKTSMAATSNVSDRALIKPFIRHWPAIDQTLIGQMDRHMHVRTQEIRTYAKDFFVFLFVASQHRNDQTTKLANSQPRTKLLLSLPVSDNNTKPSALGLYGSATLYRGNLPWWCGKRQFFCSQAAIW